MDDGALVQAGYNAIAASYLDDRNRDSADVQALGHLLERLRPGARVLDAGCGAGTPIATTLLGAGCRVVGVDFSTAQLALARRHAPGAALFCQDLTRLGFAAASFDAVCSYYAIIHIPREQHESLLADLYRLLRPGGWAFLCLGAESLGRDLDDDYFGATMFWSHYDAATYLALLPRLGYRIAWHDVISDSLGGEAATGGHLFILAQKPG